MILAVLQFASLAMLGWMAAAAAPILIHLFTRKRFKRVTWAAMEYLLAAMQKNRRRIQLEQWLLLAVRTLLLVLLGLALADPILSRSGLLQPGSTTLPTHRLFVLDASYSMATKSNGTSRFEAAQEAIRRILNECPQGDGYSLVLLADPPQVIVGDPAFSKDDLLEELNACAVTDELGDLEAALAEVDTITSSARQRHTRLAETAIYLLGDGERSTWEKASTATVKARLKKLAAQAHLSLIDLGSESTPNAALVAAEVVGSPITVDREITVQGDVVAYGPSMRGSRLVTLVVDRQAISQQGVEFDSSGRGTVAFQHKFAAPGDHTIELRLTDDALAVDNHRYLSVPVRESVKVLCVGGRAGETRFVRTALQPEATATAAVVVEEATVGALAEMDLASFDAVFLVNLPELDTDLTGALKRYVQSGGGLVLFPGDQLQIAESPAGPDTNFLPARYKELSSNGEYRFVPLEYRHPLVAPFRGFERAGLLTVPTWKYVRLVPEARDDVNVALAFDSGDPAIVEGRFGLGRIILFATAASESLDTSADLPTPWTALPTWPSFPPLIQESLALVTRSREESRNRTVGDSLSATLANATSDTEVVVELPDAGKGATRRSVRLEPFDDAWRWSFSDTARAGVYGIDLGAPLNRTDQFAINIDPRESPLERIDISQLPTELTSHGGEMSDATNASAVRSGAAFAWFPWLLGGTLALLVIETGLARWLGGHRS